MTDYNEAQTKGAVPWLQTPIAQSFLRALGYIKDAYLLAAKKAVKSRFIYGDIPSDALDRLGANFQIERAYAHDTDTFLAQLRNAWAKRSIAGTKASLVQAFNEYGLPNVQVFETFQWSFAHPERWWQFVVLIQPPFVWADAALADGEWGDAGTWGDGGVWSQGIPQDHYARLRGLVNKWRPAHARGVFIILLEDGELWDYPEGTWDEGSATWGDGADAVYLDGM